MLTVIAKSISVNYFLHTYNHHSFPCWAEHEVRSWRVLTKF